ncbi:MAG: hypothetical protein HQ469_05470 [Cyanobacteria bacterium]|nr:hypothetical protein [Cyanobacteria bacterium bin.275]
MVLEFDRQGWITVFAGLLLALITLFTNYAHVDLLGGAAALATALNSKLAFNDR